MNQFINNKKQLILTLGILFLGIFMIAGSFAYWTWNSNKTKTIVFNTASSLEKYIVYDSGDSKFVGDFKVSDTYTDGIHSSISVKKTEEAENYKLYATVFMDINKIGDYMKESSALKWVITNSAGDILNSGNFFGNSAGDTLELLTPFEVTTTEQRFTVWIWVDGSEDVDANLTGETLDVEVYTQIDQVVEERLVITKKSARFKKISATVVGNNNIVSYAVSTSNTQPTTFTNIPTSSVGKTYTLEYDAPSEGTYYIWFKDSTGKVVSDSITISNLDKTAPVCVVDKKDITYSVSGTINVTCTDASSGMVNKKLTTGDFTVSDTTVAEIQSVSDPIAVDNGYKYILVVKGLNAGTYNLSIKAGGVEDKTGNVNALTTQTENVKKLTVKLSLDQSSGTNNLYDTSSFNATVKSSTAVTGKILVTSQVLYGDVDLNGKVNSADVGILKAYINGTETLSETGKKLADLNLDGQINQDDVDLLAQFLIKEVTTLPVASESRPFGDVNGDGNIDGTDATIIRRYYANLLNPGTYTTDASFDELGSIVGDVNLDGTIDGIDADRITKYVANRAAIKLGKTPPYGDLELPELVRYVLLSPLSSSESLKGDANGDGIITFEDAALIVEYAKGNITEDEINEANADIDGRYGITVGDAQYIINYINKTASEAVLSLLSAPNRLSDSITANATGVTKNIQYVGLDNRIYQDETMPMELVVRFVPDDIENIEVAEVTYMSTFTPKEFTVTLDNDGGVGGTTKIYGKAKTGLYLDSGYTNEMTTSANKITVPTKTGYTFDGYYYFAGSSSAKMIYGSGYINSSAVNYLGTDITLKAVWKDKTAPVCTISKTDITYGVNGTITVTCTDNATLDIITLSKSNFTISDTSVAEIVSVSSPVAVANGYKYSVVVKGLKAGDYTLSLNANSVYDDSDNGNVLTSQSETIKKLVPTLTLSQTSGTNDLYNYSSFKATVTSPTTVSGKLVVTSQVLYGDANLDGEVDMRDALLLSDYVNGNADISEKAKSLVDLDLDGQIDIFDVQYLLDMINSDDGTVLPYLPDGRVWGDANGDGKANSSDSALLVRYYRNIIEPGSLTTNYTLADDIAKITSDVNLDSTIDPLDAQYVFNHAMNITGYSEMPKLKNYVTIYPLKYDEYLKGEVDTDGIVTINDNYELILYNTSSWNAIILEGADINGDGNVDGTDSTILNQYIQGSENKNIMKYFNYANMSSDTLSANTSGISKWIDYVGTRSRRQSETWNPPINLTVRFVPDDFDNVEVAEGIYSATYEPNKYSIKLDANGGTGGTATIYGSARTGIYLDSTRETLMSATENPITIPTRSGYVFDGYYYKANDSETIMRLIDKNGYVSSGAYYALGDYITLYANWTKADNYEVLDDTTSIGTYATLADAYTGITNNSLTTATIKVLKSNTDSSNLTIASDKRITIDTNGMTITRTTYPITNNGWLYITGTGTIQTSEANLNLINTTLRLYVRGGTLSSTNGGIAVSQTAGYAYIGTNGDTSTTSPHVEGKNAFSVTGGYGYVYSGKVNNRYSASYPAISVSGSSSRVIMRGGLVTEYTSGGTGLEVVGLSSGASFTIYGGTVQTAYSGGRAVASYSSSNVYVYGGTLSSTNGPALLLNSGSATITSGTMSNATASYPVISIGGSSVSMTGGTLSSTADTNGIKLTSGTLSVTSGTYSWDKTNAYILNAGGTVNIGTSGNTSTTSPSLDGYKTIEITSGTMNMYSGVVSHTPTDYNSTAVLINGSSSILTMTGGKILSPYSADTEASTITQRNGIFNMNGGSIECDTKTLSDGSLSDTVEYLLLIYGGTFNMTGGSISSPQKNLATAIYNIDGVVNIGTSGDTSTTMPNITAAYSIYMYGSSSGAIYIYSGNLISGVRNYIYDGTLYMMGGLIQSGDNVAISHNGGTVYLSGGTIQNSSSSSVTFVESGGTLNMSGGAITSTLSTTAIRVNSGTVNITGGTYDWSIDSTYIYQTGGSVNMSGGTIKASKSRVLYLTGGTFTMTGGLMNTLTGSSNNTIYQSAGTLYLNGGYVVGEGGSSSSYYSTIYSSGGTISVNGGTVFGNEYAANLIQYSSSTTINIQGKSQFYSQKEGGYPAIYAPSATVNINTNSLLTKANGTKVLTWGSTRALYAKNAYLGKTGGSSTQYTYAPGLYSTMTTPVYVSGTIYLYSGGIYSRATSTSSALSGGGSWGTSVSITTYSSYQTEEPSVTIPDYGSVYISTSYNSIIYRSS